MAKQAAMMEERMKKMGKKKPLIKKDGDVSKSNFHLHRACKAVHTLLFLLTGLRVF